MTAPQVPESEPQWQQQSGAAVRGSARVPVPQADQRGQAVQQQDARAAVPAQYAPRTDQRAYAGAAGTSTAGAEAARQAARVAAGARAAVTATGVGATGSAAAVGAPRAASSSSGPRGPVSDPAGFARPETPGARRLGVAQVLSWQIAIVAILVTWGRHPAVTAAASVVAAVCLIVTGLPWRGVWLYQWLGLRMRYSWRTRHSPRPGALDDPRLALLKQLQPSVVVGELQVDGQAVATIAHPSGITAVLELAPGNHTLFGAESRRLPDLVSLLPVGEPDLPPVVVQSLIRAEAVTAWPGAGAAFDSYRLLTEGEVPTERQGWLCVQVRRTPEACHDDDLRPALLNAIQRARRRLRQDKLPNRLLGPEELLVAAAVLARLEPGVSGPSANGAVPARESWNRVTTGRTVQASFRIKRWPTQQWTIDRLLSNMTTTATVAVAATSDPVHTGDSGKIAMELVIRLAAPDQVALETAGKRLAELFGAIGGEVERLDGRQAAGLAATLPFGGFLL
ncbi:type VII secretion protein EccE [Actinoplanes sp. GCM10030250]|uniref:type VII secretion protein EccE n=1 Tax=Actinoplanes sp. GCM10030250 TaxID=3273376 RepID=UPI00361D3DCF